MDKEKLQGLELNDECLEMVNGGATPVEITQRVLKEMGIDATDAFVEEMLRKGGSVMRDWAKMKTGGNPKCNLIPCI